MLLMRYYFNLILNYTLNYNSKKTVTCVLILYKLYNMMKNNVNDD